MTKALLDEPTDPQITTAAAAIIDLMMGGDQSWRSRLADSDFLESADWATAMSYAEAALRSSAPQEPCTMGVGCDEAGVCYAAAHGEPERCPKVAQEPVVDDDAEWLDSWLDRRLYSLTDDEQRRLRRIAARLQAKAPETGEE